MLNPFTIALLASVAGVANAKCNRDNCLRAIIASAFPTRSGSADCALYLRTTVTPATVTQYATVTQTGSTTTTGTALVVTTTTDDEPFFLVKTTTATAVETDIVTLPAQQKRHQQRPQPEKPRCESEIPTYASACSGAVRYSSACSCVGATPTTVFAAAPTTVVTVTEIATATFTELTTTTSIETTTDRITITTPFTETTTTTTATTTTAAPTRPAFQQCTGPYNELGAGGCGPTCFCDETENTLQVGVGFCNADYACGGACMTTLDCPLNSACASNHPECYGAGVGVCLDFSLCLAVDINLPTLPELPVPEVPVPELPTLPEVLPEVPTLPEVLPEVPTLPGVLPEVPTLPVPKKRLAMRADARNRGVKALIRPTN